MPFKKILYINNCELIYIINRILGPTALLQLANRGDALPRIHRPMYSISLLGKVIVFTGFRNKSELVN